MSKIVAISDIHGEYDKLARLLDNLALSKDDTVVFCGDYIDRGKKSKEVVDTAIELGDFCNCVYLIGSHEYAMMHANSDDYYNYLFWNYGGDSTVENYGSFENIMKIHGDFFRNLKYYHIIGKYLFVHAGFRIGVSLEKQSEVDMVYIRHAFFEHKHDFDYKIIFGHTEFPEPQVWDDKICIDTGCGKFPNAPLTALIIEDGKEYFVSSAD